LRIKVEKEFEKGPPKGGHDTKASSGVFGHNRSSLPEDRIWNDYGKN
jgi:hypothetical protein